ncbi:hypothetical protein ANO14919_070490 [Xylariales sp. No.14919]|nr:hypothetical protein ANO14919_070490 [Xylariales sp. No.14919]
MKGLLDLEDTPGRDEKMEGDVPSTATLGIGRFSNNKHEPTNHIKVVRLSTEDCREGAIRGRLVSGW